MSKTFAMPEKPPLLAINGVTAGYGAATVLRDVSLHLGPQEVVALLGANGAGKTSLLRVISGQLPVRAGEVHLDGMSLTKKRPDQTVRAGVSHVLEGRQIFPQMTVRENLLLGASARGGDKIYLTLEKIFAAFPIMREKAGQRAGELSGGQQQMVVIGRALMARPTLLLLDEPSLGLAPVMFEPILRIIAWARETLGASVLLVEQHTRLALSVASRGYVMASGRIVAEDSAAALLTGDALRSAYLMGQVPTGPKDPGHPASPR